ncbi:MAG: hypothetical protein H7A53_08120 [Akkermansiaceae bacterium]|nr:hypothetical protein [Akkermansiaceae bacterium]
MRKETGVFTLNRRPRDTLQAGDVGYLIAEHEVLAEVRSVTPPSPRLSAPAC